MRERGQRLASVTEYIIGADQKIPEWFARITFLGIRPKLQWSQVLRPDLVQASIQALAFSVFCGFFLLTPTLSRINKRWAQALGVRLLSSKGCGEQARWGALSLGDTVPQSQQPSASASELSRLHCRHQALYPYLLPLGAQVGLSKDPSSCWILVTAQGKPVGSATSKPPAALLLHVFPVFTYGIKEG